MKKIFLIILIIIVLSINIFADIIKPAAFLNIGTARATGMGGAFTAVADDSTCIFYNPAGIPLSEYKDISFMYTKQKFLIPYNYVSMIYPINKLRGFGVGIVISGDDLMDEKTFLLSYSENIGQYLKFLKIFNYLYVGTNLKFQFSGFGNNISDDKVTGSAWGVGLDLGLLWTITKQIQFGVMLRDSFSYISWTSNYNGIENTYNEGIPLTSGVGIRYKFLDFLASAEITDLDRLHLGIEKNFFRYIDIRLGYIQTLDIESFKEYTFGLGIGHFKLGTKNRPISFNLDTSYSLERLDNTLKVQLSFKFK